jgi:hypothetical protein
MHELMPKRTWRDNSYKGINGRLDMYREAKPIKRERKELQYTTT